MKQWLHILYSVCFINAHFAHKHKLHNIQSTYETNIEKTNVVVRIRCDTNQAVQPNKLARSLKFLIYEVEGWLCPCENKGAVLCLVFADVKHLFSHDVAHICFEKK